MARWANVNDISSVNSEAGILATLVHNPELYFQVDNLLPNHFSNMENRLLYTAMGDLIQSGVMDMDAYNIVQDLSANEATRRLANDISIDRVNEFIENSGIIARHTVEEYKKLAGIVIDTAMRRDMFRALRECEDVCLNDSLEDVQRIVSDKIDDVIAGYAYNEELYEMSEIIDDIWDDIELRQQGRNASIPFKFPTLNTYVEIEPGELVVLAAPAKGAKSMFMLNEAVDMARRGKSILYIDSELSDRLFTIRLLSHLTGIEFRRVKSGNYSPEEANSIRTGLDTIKGMNFYHVYMPIFEQQGIYTAVKKVNHRLRESPSGKLDVLIVDYLKSSGDTDAYATYAELGRLADLIKNDIAGAMGISALAAAQLTSTGRLADSAKIARNASTILYLEDKSPEEIETDGAECGNKKLVVKLNRNGMQHVDGEYIDIAFDGDRIMLTEAKQHIPDAPY